MVSVSNVVSICRRRIVALSRPWWLHWPWNWVKALDQDIDRMLDELGEFFGHDRMQKRMEDYC
jgi:hypothetical protein